MFRELLTSLFQQWNRPTRRAVRRPHLKLECLGERSVPAIITVTTLIDESNANDTLSLREAIAQAAATASDDTIEFAEGLAGSIDLSGGQLLLGNLFEAHTSGEVIIDGGGVITLDAGGRNRVIEIQSGTVILNGLTITNGYNDLGGGVMAWDGSTVTLQNTRVVDNLAITAGGGIFSGGVLTLIDSEVSHNYSKGGGGGIYIYGNFGGSLTVIDSTIANNQARAHGGGIYNTGEKLTLTGATLNSNTARNGGGIYNNGGNVAIATSTFTNNQASPGKGNDIYNTANSAPIDYPGIDIYQEESKPKKGGRN